MHMFSQDWINSSRQWSKTFLAAISRRWRQAGRQPLWIRWLLLLMWPISEHQTWYCKPTICSVIKETANEPRCISPLYCLWCFPATGEESIETGSLSFYMKTIKCDALFHSYFNGVFRPDMKRIIELCGRGDYMYDPIQVRATSKNLRWEV